MYQTNCLTKKAQKGSFVHFFFLGRPNSSVLYYQIHIFFSEQNTAQLKILDLNILKSHFNKNDFN